VSVNTTALAYFLAVGSATAVGGEGLFLVGRSFIILFAVLGERNTKVLGIVILSVAEKSC
jgi:hypothetical protein